MKDKQVKAADKTFRKKIKLEIGMTIVNDLQKIAGKFKATSKKTDKQIKKAADKLARKLSKGIKAVETAAPKANAAKTTGDAAPKATTAKPAAPKATTKPAETKAKAVVTEPVKAQPAEKAKRGPKAKPAAEPLK